MNRERNENNGRYANNSNPNDILEAMTSGEPYITSEIQEQVDIPRSTTHRYLNRLADEGEIRKKKPNSRTVIWIRSD